MSVWRRAASVKGNRGWRHLCLLGVQFVGARLLMSVNPCLDGVVNRLEIYSEVAQDTFIYVLQLFSDQVKTYDTSQV